MCYGGTTALPAAQLAAPLVDILNQLIHLSQFNQSVLWSIKKSCDWIQQKRQTSGISETK